jgi:peptidoglycan/LPS O-acetylase OafA/YrhL
MRLLLAVEVVFAHAWSVVDPNFEWSGFIMAVPAFLAISGFLVLQSYEDSSTWGHFMKKRMLRIFPALIFSFALCYALFDRTSTYNSVLVWATGGLYQIGRDRNVPLWSLAWEELAYLSLAVLWALGAYKRAIFIWLLLVASIVLVWQTSHLALHIPYLHIILFLPTAFLVGNLMYFYRGRLRNIPPIVPWITLYGAIQFCYAPGSNLLGGAPVVLAQAFAVVWVSIAGFRAIPWRIPDISYGVYIYHWPFIMWVSRNYEVKSLPQLLLYVSLFLIPFSIFSWYMIEKPALKLKNWRPVPKGALAE